jgi:hypothetical protein
MDLSLLTSFAQWDDATKQVLDLQGKWKTLGFASRKMNNQLFERFRKSCDEFFAKKAIILFEKMRRCKKCESQETCQKHS